ncbi:Dihydrolipoyllysine-residue acetyltransferase component of pyruvate dehydrogenase complex [Microbacterium sp. Bi98]|uniref:dihydrolipoamide acetyltransferase family protein n=1 Tax=Microbacterium sp. Bi98 TaxID=2821116 RepID=UPI001E03CA8B|nr:dihydrolipoamide acetyltransferase family protein [Microbacterium sp. Bi98]CAH0245899.1 Dihydrolipoyllysine-residue acetyltransferase component of pyruvate dehydrogenase complex [Microbacterium sp. Bi98]
MTALTTHVFRLPDLGEGLTEAGLVQWLVCVGDTIVTDQAIAEVETAKSVVELPSPFAGVVTALHGEPGETIDVGAPVLEVADGASSSSADPSSADAPDTDAGGDLRADAGDPEQEAYREEERAGSGNVLIGYGTTERGATGRRRPKATAASEMPREKPDANASERRPVAVRSPLVRRLARDLGLDVHAITPTGHDGAVTRADVLAAAVDDAVDGAAAQHRRDDHQPQSANAERLDGLAVVSRERMSPLRKAVSARLTRSRSEIPEATVWVDVDATELWNLRSEMVPAGGRAPSITALVARFVVLALAEHPVLASRLSDDGSEIISFDGLNLGVAADTERGLLVPVIPRAHELTVEQLDVALRELSATARSGAMPPERLRGSTFTLNNYGGLGVDGSAAIINHPDVAILGIGRIIERPWVIDGQIVARRVAQLSLVFDHRVCDGGYAASFLRRVTELIEHPLRAFGKV